MEKLDSIIKNIEPIDKALLEETQRRLDSLTKPKASLGRLEELAKQIVSITRQQEPEFKNKVIFTMAGDHGVAEEGVSAFPREVTPQMVYNFLNGGAAINVLARHVGARVVVVDMGVAEKVQSAKFPSTSLGTGKAQNFKDKKVGFGTKNMAKGPAMTREQAIRSVNAGIEVFEEELKAGIDIAGIGDMGIANTTSSSAIIAALSGEEPRNVTGRGTGIDAASFEKKVGVIKKALAINRPDSKDPIDVLTKVGGFEIGGLCGVTLAAARYKIPLVLDGFIATAGALLACELCSTVKEYLIASHNSVERGHIVMLGRMGLRPLLNLDLRLGEGTGAALGISICEASVKMLTQMATFESAGVSDKTVPDRHCEESRKAGRRSNL